ncbi:NAD(P)/FAD-dependent oxidoreductase [Bordetella avium]|uniref:Dehydrogenase n=1 Tax=Bordetella avium (strain 197N) TaxID=360910 RepID=Q2KZJ5_BORA1|nr:FAD-dependent oxidoreductase [Bordetella avium]AZY49399.1 NAD/FAD-binding protein [Bordetella avium]AZY52752.1 NAD/FAD-binding protein [Bordetella avium]RIQ12094.1 FAD-dependent oxidoreductase [Bordetella avium]RIQ19087.1 FAD-dependent oxidoreductase [Bordetella avium]RIQ31997.1 FAD-dependent oxidoreductase [Bordetella avium]
MKVAVIGSGISGLAAAHRLRGQAHVTLFEAQAYFGGHTHTVDVSLPDARGQPVTQGVDTGFLVLNERTYPGLIALLDALQVRTVPSDMSFSVQVPGAGALGAQALEWNGSNLATVFAQKRNLLRPRFLGMLAELLRFNRLCTALAEGGQEQALAQPLGEFLDQHGFGAAFRHWYFLPMLGCIWSCPTDQMLRFPVATMVRFCHNHGLIQVQNRPQWRTVAGGARQYVSALLPGLDARLATPVMRIERHAGGVLIRSSSGAEHFDAVVLAVHSDQALRLLAQPSVLEQQVLGAIRYQPNRAVLHTDTRVMPRRRAAWAAWNYERAADDRQESARVCLHYWINRLQPLPFAQPVLVSLNPVSRIESSLVLGEFDYEHPVFDLAALAAQKQVPQLQGGQHTWYAGAWTGYGFHEDGLQSGYRAADALLAHWQRAV